MALSTRAGESSVHPEGARSGPEGSGTCWRVRGRTAAASGARSFAALRINSQQGFTLAGLIVVMTIMMIFVAYTVPRQWSTVMKRERERETFFAMQQYAKAIQEFQDKHKIYPNSIKELQDARQPRMIRGPKGEFIDALTGEVDWLIIPQSAATA